MYLVSYSTSRALIIGINAYSHASPLGYAVHDATALAELLVEKLGFDQSNVKVLIDGDATRLAILKSFFSFSGAGTQENDRLIIFFAGHGHTVTSNRGEVGFLVPSDGDAHDLSTLIRWDELTRGADLILAKHVLFIMDACYGGLAVTRSFNPGAMRFLRDMMQRLSRQVLTAGKADETVADLGGPLPQHSVFTGHLLEALSGKAKDNYGNLTANGVTAYVYQAVSADATAKQTPHYGYLHGDGDLIFHPLQDAEPLLESDAGDERLVSVPAILQGNSNVQIDDTERLKELLSDNKYRIQLHDFVVQRTREVLSRTSQDHFSTQGMVVKETFLERLHNYEKAVEELIPQEMLIGRWGRPEHVASLRMPIKRLAERLSPAAGSTFLSDSRWYPVFLLMYAGGIGSIVGGSFSNLFSLLHTPTIMEYGETRGDALLVAITKPISNIHDSFKWFPEHERHFVPRSEYIYRLLQPSADDTLFIGEEYEAIFDQFELIYSLQFAHLDNPQPLVGNERVWGPIGRFGWRGRHYGPSPLQKLVAEAKQAGPSWEVFEAGFFGKSIQRVEELAAGLEKTLSQMPWF